MAYTTLAMLQVLSLQSNFTYSCICAQQQYVISDLFSTAYSCRLWPACAYVWCWYSRGGDSAEAIGVDHCTPLLLAAEGAHLDCVEALLSGTVLPAQSAFNMQSTNTRAHARTETEAPVLTPHLAPDLRHVKRLTICRTYIGAVSSYDGRGINRQF